MNWAWLHEIKHDGSPDVGSKKRSVLRNFLSQPARSASNEGELHASFLTQTCARCNGLARNRRAITSHRARAVTCCAGNVLVDARPRFAEFKRDASSGFHPKSVEP